MEEHIKYETLKQPIYLSDDRSVFVTAIGHVSPADALRAEKQLNERRDLFVKSFRFIPKTENTMILLNPTVYIQDSVENQHGGKITSFINRINEMISEAREISKYSKHIAPYDWQEKQYQPTITLSIKCNDKTLGPKSNKIISTLKNAQESGIQIEVINKCAANSAWNAVFKSSISHTK